MNATRISRILLYITLLITIGAVSSAAFAQSDRGSVTGKVTDNSGALLPNATVTLTNEATGVSQTATSNQSGEYVFQLLNPGTYDLSVTAQGFKSEKRTHIVVDVNQANDQNVALNVGGATETVEVSAGGVQQLQTETGSMSLVVEQRSIEELPLVYGNPFTLETLAPGISLSGVNPNIHTYDSSSATVSVNGSHSTRSSTGWTARRITAFASPRTRRRPSSSTSTASRRQAMTPPKGTRRAVSRTSL